METQTKFIADNSVNTIIRSYQKDDQILYLYGIDNIICGIVKSTSFQFSSFEIIVPVGMTIVGVIAIYNENTAEDFDEVLNAEIVKVQSDILKDQNAPLIALAIKDVLCLDDNDAFDFDVHRLNEMEIELEFVDDLIGCISNTYHLFRTTVELSLGDNSVKGLDLPSDIDALKEMKLIINIKDNKQQLMIDNVGQLTKENSDHLSQFIAKINLASKQSEGLKCINFSFGVKAEIDSPQSIEVIKCSDITTKQLLSITLSLVGMISNKHNTFNDTLTKMFRRLVAMIKTSIDSLKNGKELLQGVVVYNKLHNCVPLNVTQLTPFTKKSDSIMLSEESKIVEESEISSKYHIKGVGLFNHNPVIMTKAKYQSSKLLNLHQQIHKAIPSNTIRACVKGSYEYFHYCHDNVQDSGWGCAYRSLQTLFSWFLLNTDLGKNKSVPSIKDIQTALVLNGDKPKEFIASTEWIGAYEVSIVLNDLLRIESQIIYIQSGAELHSKGRDLIYHFQHMGSPVMIGGGKYAYTILGVDYDRVQGKCDFLILDPHYGGEDTPKILLDKGWCGWKSIALFQKENFYNMCMPLIP